MVFGNVFDGVFGGPGVVVEGEDGAVVAEFAGGYGKDAGACADVHHFFVFQVEMLHLAQHQTCCGVIAGAERHFRVDFDDDLAGFWRYLTAFLDNEEAVGDFDGLQGCLPIGVPVPVGDEGCGVEGKRAHPFLQHGVEALLFLFVPFGFGQVGEELVILFEKGVDAFGGKQADVELVEVRGYLKSQFDKVVCSGLRHKKAWAVINRVDGGNIVISSGNGEVEAGCWMIRVQRAKELSPGKVEMEGVRSFCRDDACGKGVVAVVVAFVEVAAFDTVACGMGKALVAGNDADVVDDAP